MTYRQTPGSMTILYHSYSSATNPYRSYKAKNPLQRHHENPQITTDSHSVLWVKASKKSSGFTSVITGSHTMQRTGRGTRPDGMNGVTSQSYRLWACLSWNLYWTWTLVGQPTNLYWSGSDTLGYFSISVNLQVDCCRLLSEQQQGVWKQLQKCGRPERSWL